GRARKLSALADLELDIVHNGADWNIGDRHRVAGFYVGMLGRDHAVARTQTLRRQNIGELTVLVLDQRNEGRAVRIVFQPLDGRRHIELGAAEIDTTKGLFVRAVVKKRGQ